MWRGSLRNPNAPTAARWDWGWLRDCFGSTNISLSDVDATIYAIERKASILWIEIKKPEEEVPYGQLRLLMAFSTKPQCCAIVLWGQQDAPRAVQWISHGDASDIQTTTREEIHEWIAAWFRRANRDD